VIIGKSVGYCFFIASPRRSRAISCPRGRGQNGGDRIDAVRLPHGDRIAEQVPRNAWCPKPGPCLEELCTSEGESSRLRLIRRNVDPADTAWSSGTQVASYSMQDRTSGQKSRGPICSR